MSSFLLFFVFSVPWFRSLSLSLLAVPGTRVPLSKDIVLCIRFSPTQQYPALLIWTWKAWQFSAKVLLDLRLPCKLLQSLAQPSCQERCAVVCGLPAWVWQFYCSWSCSKLEHSWVWRPFAASGLLFVEEAVSNGNWFWQLCHVIWDGPSWIWRCWSSRLTRLYYVQWLRARRKPKFIILRLN